MQDSLHNLGVKWVNLSISYGSTHSIKRTVSFTADVSAEEAAQIDHLIKLNATFLADLHVEGYQPELTSEIFEAGTTVTADVTEVEATAPGGDGNQPTEAVPSEPKTRKKKDKVGTATKIGSGPPIVS